MFHLNITIMILAEIFLIGVVTFVAGAFVLSVIDTVTQLRH